MILIKNHKQAKFFGPRRFFSPKRRQLLDTIWPGFFKIIILPELSASSIFPFFSDEMGRPFKNLKRQNKDLFETIRADLIEKYLPEKFLQCFSMVKPSTAQKTLAVVSNDLFDLVLQFKDKLPPCTATKA